MDGWPHGSSWAQPLVADRLALAIEQDDLAEDAAWWDEGHKEPGRNGGTCVDRLQVNGCRRDTTALQL